MVYDTDGDLTRFGVHGPWCVPYSALVTLYFFMFPVGGGEPRWTPYACVTDYVPFPSHAEYPLSKFGGRRLPLDPEPLSPVSGGGWSLHVGNGWLVTRMAT